MDNKVTILEPNKTEALTYTIFRDSEKNLYLAVYREDGAYRFTAYDVNLFSIEICDGKGNDCELVKGTAFECFKEVNAHIKYHFGEGYAVYDDKGFFFFLYPVCQAKKENEWAVMEDNGGTNN